MAGRPRKPTALQEAAGRDKQNPARYRDRKSNTPDGMGDLGDPPDYITDTPECKARSAWFAFAKELPWLNKSDTAILEAACMIRGDVMAKQAVGVPRLTLLRGLLQSLGATPADKSKVTSGASGEGGKSDEKEVDIFNES